MRTNPVPVVRPIPLIQQCRKEDNNIPDEYNEYLDWTENAESGVEYIIPAIIKSFNAISEL